MELNDKNQLPVDGVVDSVRGKLTGKNGKSYWRSLDELADTPQFNEWLEDEFPNRSTLKQINRRDLLKFMGASMALAGLSGCRGVFLPQDKVVPYVKAPEELVPGKPLFYATAVTLGGYATGVLVEQREGRPIFIQGNPDHPASLGSLDSISQAEILNFYDPDRTSNVVQQSNPGQYMPGDISTWELFLEAAEKALTAEAATGGAGVRLLTGSITSPTLVNSIKSFLKKYPNAVWHSYEPAGRGNAYAGAKLAFGRPLETLYDFSKATVIVSLDGDFLSPTSNPGSVRYARDFANGRRVTGLKGSMNRLYAFESTPALVGSVADHRWAVKPSDVYGIAMTLAAAVGVAGAVPVGKADPKAIDAIAKDLLSAQGGAVVVTGDQYGPEVHAIVHAINEKLGAYGKTVFHTEPIDATVAASTADLKSLVDDLNTGKAKTLFIVGGNPVYDAPADLKFADALAKAPFRARLGLYDDETAQACDWLVPITHSLEEWGDARAFDGTLSVMQPLIAPLYQGKSVIEVLGLLSGKPSSGYDLVKGYWKQAGFLKGDFEKEWRQAVHDGLVKGSTATPVTPALALQIGSLTAPRPVSGLEVIMVVDPCIYDGRYANNGWLQELPKPLSKLTWENVAMLSPKTAAALGVEDSSVVDLTCNGVTVRTAAYVQPGHPADAVTVYLGFGRTRGGLVCSVPNGEGKPSDEDTRHPGGFFNPISNFDGGGFNAYLFRTSAAPHFTSGELKAVGGVATVASTQGHAPIDGDHVKQFVGDDREVIVEYDLNDFNLHAAKYVEERKARSKDIAEQNLYPDQIFVYDGPQWAMTIDLNTCIGCNACVTACQAENNIPVVGKVQVARHREMHWIRIDRYYSGDGENPQVAWQPVACVQCEKAPCEPVCPVAATVHSHEGINQMVYNRCVGTRYCSNNCPYKVRRFNYLNYTDNQRQFDVRVDDKPRIPLLRMLNNPDVTVRGRGIMEKCTYCIQRINEARIESKKAARDIQDGDIVTACQQACPTQTIVFGNKEDKDSQVAKMREDPRAYLLMESLQTRPRTSHLAKLRNPNKQLAPTTATETNS
ncbi:MAG: TAT-variant-translocated molybdopterin oxidoreductase [Fimbriimonas sp.]|nr:TAT-variant-translocated molybdopterin oxidoreductase [Fimbriimonas sp.]